MKGEQTQPGLIPLSLKYIFDKIEKVYLVFKKSADFDAKSTISYFEVYNENIYDLLANPETPLIIRETTSSTNQIINLQEFSVENAKDSLSLL